MASPVLLLEILLFVTSTVQLQLSHRSRIPFTSLPMPSMPSLPSLPSPLNPDQISERMTDTVKKGIRIRSGQDSEDDTELEKLLAQNQGVLQTTSLASFRDNITSRLLYRFMRSYFSQDPNEAVRFFLYDDSSDPSFSKEIFINDDNSLRSIVVPEDSHLKILIHGFTGSVNSSFPQDMKNAFLESTNHPIICVDWSTMAGMPRVALRHLQEGLLYNGIADYNVPKVGHHVARFIYEVRRNNVVPSLDRIHLIGHSLGAHVSGEAGRTLQVELSPEENQVGRITGLDPANPHFEDKTHEHRLDGSDAKFVDIIHTSHLLGDRRSTGHVDFYPNPDSFPQPGCEEKNQTLGRVIPNSFRNLIGSCDHHRAVDFYSASITNTNFNGCRFLAKDNTGVNDDDAEPERKDKPKEFRKCSDECSSSIIFGEHANHNVRGEYCLIMKLE
ncbi:unnamed protein product [Orchesella dallaii]|uniref:Lipase domain-containing protein n=1 Tax=Orchesella dallaii TaxID=48710 RepID=A0ABP1Q7C5_9HEXA